MTKSKFQLFKKSMYNTPGSAWGLYEMPGIKPGTATLASDYSSGPGLPLLDL